GCGRSQTRPFARVAVSPWPGGPGPLVAERAVETPLPANRAQTCHFGPTVTVTVGRRTVRYGPCELPSAIARLRLEMVRAAEPARPSSGSAAGWKAVLDDWYDGSIDRWHSCAAVREAIRHLPVDGPIYSTVFPDLRHYARAVCWPS